MKRAKIVGTVDIDPEYNPKYEKEEEAVLCTKVPFDTPQQAHAALARIKKKGADKERDHKYSRKETKVYRCEVCGRYHTTSQKRNKR